MSRKPATLPCSTCPRCKGAGKTLYLVDGRYRNGRQFSRQEESTCVTCRGTGKIGAEQDERFRRGEAVRQQRVSAGRSLLTEALRIGVEALLLCHYENGRMIEESIAAKIEAAQPKEYSKHGSHDS